MPSSLPRRMRPGSYLAVQQLRLRPPVAFDLIADAVEERYAVLLLVAAGKLPQHLPGLLCKGRAEEGRVRLGLASGTPCSPPRPPPAAPTPAGCALGTHPQHQVLMGAAAALPPTWGSPTKRPQAQLCWVPAASHMARLGTFAPSHLAGAAAVPSCPQEQGSARGHRRARCPLPSPASPGTRSGLAQSFFGP